MSDYSSYGRPFPKIAAVLGAHSPLGQRLFLDLLNSPEIDKVHAIATDTIRAIDYLSDRERRKARVHLVHFDNMETAFARIRECDLAFCVSITERHAYDQIGHKRFRHLNASGPILFIDKMFDLGVLHISLLSHLNADSASRSEFNKCRGDVEDYLRDLRREAADFSPYISTFKVPTLIDSASSSKQARDRLKNRVGEPLGSDSRMQPVEVREVATIMQIDAFAKAKACSDRPPGTKKKRTVTEDFFSYDVVRMLRMRNSDRY